MLNKCCELIFSRHFLPVLNSFLSGSCSCYIQLNFDFNFAREVGLPNDCSVTLCVSCTVTRELLTFGHQAASANVISGIKLATPKHREQTH